jgi:ABC-2 type transport system permease protein
MSKARIFAIFWRHIYNFKHSWDRLFDSFYWPALDILLWGLTSVYIKQASTTIPDIVVILLSGLVYWQVVWRSQYEITVNLLEELWSHNFVNLFATPLKVSEWVVSVLLLGIVKMVFTVGFALFLVFSIYGVNMFEVGWYMVPFVILLLASGWFIGFFVAGIILRYGKRIQTIAWAGVYLFAPFSAIYYTVDTLPDWAQKVSRLVPMSYIFEGMRTVLLGGYLDIRLLGVSSLLVVVYMVLSIWFFYFMFRLSRKAGLASLE